MLRLPNQNRFWYGFDRAKNAHTMEEKCIALETAGATFFKNPEESVYGFEDAKPPSEEYLEECEAHSMLIEFCRFLGNKNDVVSREGLYSLRRFYTKPLSFPPPPSDLDASCCACTFSAFFSNNF